jgi:hypothetical protein
MQIVHYPVKCRQVNRFDNTHVIQWHVQTVLRHAQEFAA